MTVGFRRQQLVAASAAAIALVIAGCLPPRPPAEVSRRLTERPISAAACKPAPTGTALKVGVIASASGPAASQGINDVPTVLKQWKQTLTCAAESAGHSVDFTYFDESNPAVAVQAAKTLVSDHVIAIMDDSTFNTEWAKIADADIFPVLDLTGSISSGLYATDPNFYATVNIGIPVGMWGITKAASLGGKKNLGLLYCAEYPGCAQLPKIVIVSYAKSLGMNLSYSAGFSASQPNYTALCLAAKSKGVDVFAPIGPPSAMLKVYKDCAAQGYQPTATFVGQGLGADFNSYKTPVPVIYGALGVIPWFVKNATTKPFYDALGSYIDSSAFKASGNTPSNLLADWAGLQMLAAAGRLVGASPSAVDIRTGLLSFDGNTLGWAGRPPYFQARTSSGKLRISSALSTARRRFPTDSSRSASTH